MSTVVPDPGKHQMDDIPARQASGPAESSEASDEPVVVQIGAFAYLRTMWSLLWTAFRHPWTTTYIDAETGEVLPGYEKET